MDMIRYAGAALLFPLLAVPCLALEVTDSVVIYEVYYDALGTDDDNEYLEILNYGAATVYLDGAVITDAGSALVPEAVFRFPGQPGGTDIALDPGGILLIAVDAIPDGLPPELDEADWEFFYQGDDNDNPNVPNLVLCATSFTKDVALASNDGVLIATGVDTIAAIDCETVVDGVNWGNPSDPVPLSSTVCEDPDTDSGSDTGDSIGRCPTFVDHNVDSEQDWFPMELTPGGPNIPIIAADCKNPVRAASWGVIKKLYRP
jgi:hypothetical protein